MKRSVVFASLLASVAAGSAAGLIWAIPNISSAASTPVTTEAPLSSASTAAPGKSKSNEDATHESGESAAREAAEDSGQFRGGFGDHHGSNEDPNHEANEDPAREAAEGAANAGGATTSTTTG